eukprot:s974_g5.t1
MPIIALTAEQEEAALEAADSDLRYLLSEVGLPDGLQAAIYHRGYVSLRLFSGIDESRAEVRAAINAEVGLDHTANNAERRQMALVLSAWETARTQQRSNDEARADARNAMIPRPVPLSEHSMLREALENQVGRLRDYEVPAKALLAAKLDDIELNQPRLEDLRDVASIEDGDADLMHGSLDASTGTFRMKAARNTIQMPKTPEELRLRHRRLGVVWEMCRTKHRGRVWLQGNLIEAYRQLSDHILGRHVAGLQLPQEQKPKWETILAYEQEIRKRAYQWVRRGDVATLEEGLEKGIKDAEVMNLFFIIPVTTSMASSSSASGTRQPPRVSPPTGGKGAGKTQNKTGVKPAKKLHVKTPDGKPLCFKFNNNGKCTSAKCSYVHQCQRWNELAARIKANEFDIILMSPPCSTWSRAVYANRLGPCPVRSREYPFGFPWLVGELKEKAELGTLLVMRCIEVLNVAPATTICLWEHPEDLGRARNGIPASVWQLEELRQAAKRRKMETIAFHQCTYGANYPKPTRFLSDANGLLQLGFPGWPVLNGGLSCLGPLPRSCGHDHDPLIGANDAGGFKTGPTAAYPAEMNQMIAQLVFNHWHQQTPTPMEGEEATKPAEPAACPRKLLVYRGREIRNDLYRLALGRCTSPPFRDETVAGARRLWLTRLADLSGKSVSELEEVDERQPFLLAALGEHLKLIGDPDAEAFLAKEGGFRAGVPIGVDGDMPRVPEVFEPKEKWKKYEPIPWPCDKENYTSAKDNATAVQLQFRKEEALGAMKEVEEEEARKQFGESLKIAALAALEKSDNSFRVVHDATHNVGVNSRIKVQDQLRYPGPSEIKAALEVMSPATFVLAADVSRAHRLVRVRPADWGLQACRTGVNDDGTKSDRVWLNCVGTFGVTSAWYHFTRLFGAVVRCAQSLWGRRDIFQLTYVDDLLFLAKGIGGLAGVWVTLLFLLIAGTPFSKFGGGTRAEWIGFQVDVKDRELGMSEKRLRWARDWMAKILGNKVVRIDEFRSALGRLAFMVSAFTHLKPFLGPLYSWVTAVDHCNTLQVPAAVLLVLDFLKRTMVPEVARTKVKPREESEAEHHFRSDAKAEGEVVVLGGWCCSDSKDRGKCRWYSVQLNRKNAPWVFESGEPYRAIASLELLGTLASLKAFPLKAGSSRRFQMSAGTDNLGNRHLVTRLLTTKFPLCIVLMQLAWTLHTKDLELRLDWLPRLQNREADALTNGDFSGFDPSLGVEVEPENLLEDQFKELLDSGGELYKEVVELRKKRKEGLLKASPVAKKAKGASLIGPW